MHTSRYLALGVPFAIVANWKAETVSQTPALKKPKKQVCHSMNPTLPSRQLNNWRGPSWRTGAAPRNETPRSDQPAYPLPSPRLGGAGSEEPSGTASPTHVREGRSLANGPVARDGLAVAAVAVADDLAESIAPRETVCGALAAVADAAFHADAGGALTSRGQLVASGHAAESPEDPVWGRRCQR